MLLLPLYLALSLRLGGLRFSLHLSLNLAFAFSAFAIQPTLAFGLRTVGLSSIFVGLPCAVEN